MGDWLGIDDEALTGMALALKKVDREARKEWARAMRTTGTRVWRSAVTKRQTTAQERIFGTASVTWSMGGKGSAKVAARPLSGTLGAAGDRDMRQVEFGSRRGDPRLPGYRPQGRVVYAALTPFGSWMGQMMVKTTADLIRDAGNVSN